MVAHIAHDVPQHASRGLRSSFVPFFTVHKVASCSGTITSIDDVAGVAVQLHVCKAELVRIEVIEGEAGRRCCCK